MAKAGECRALKNINTYNADTIYEAEKKFSQAAASGDLETLKQLFQETSKDSVVLQQIALLKACEKSQLEAIELLLRNGVSSNESYHDDTPLIRAVAGGTVETVQLLFKYGALVNVANKFSGITPLMAAACRGDLRIIKLLLDNNADINAREFFYMDTAFLLAVAAGHFETVNFFVQNNAPLEDANGRGETALMIAACRGDSDIVKLLLEKNAQIDCKNPEGMTELMLAAEYKHVEIMQLLLDKGASLTKRDNNGNTGLLVAANYCPDAVNLLLNFEVNIHDENNSGETVLMLAVHSDYEIKIIPKLIARGADVNHRDHNDCSVLMHAIYYGDEWVVEEIVEILLKAGAQVNPEAEIADTLLMCAAQQGNLLLVKLFVAHHANLNQKNQDGQTALVIARNEGSYEHDRIVEFLLQNGAQEEIQSNAPSKNRFFFEKLLRK